MEFHQFRFPLSNIPQGQSSINVKSVWQGSTNAAKARKELHDWFKAGRVSGVTQNFENQNKLRHVPLGKSLDNPLMDWLWKEQKHIVTMSPVDFSMRYRKQKRYVPSQARPGKLGSPRST